MADRLSALDVTFLNVEDRVSHMHLGSIALFEGPPPTEEALFAAIAGKLPLAPRFRQVARRIPLEAGRPVWVDDPHFDLAYHVRRTALPSPGGRAELLRLVGRVMSQQLDRSRPLWEMWVAEGLEDGTFAVVSKLHHAMVDGISGSNLITTLMDEARDAEPPEPAPWAPRPAPSDARLVADALAERARWPLREAERVLAVARDPGPFLVRGAEVLSGLAALAGLARAPASTSLNGPVGPHRAWAAASARIADVREVREAFGGTLNDVVLAAIARGFGDLLRARGEDPHTPLRTMVPVSVRPVAQAGVPDNQVSSMFAELPAGEEDPVRRLEIVHAQMRHLKATHEAEAAELLVQMAGFAPELLLAAGGRLATRSPQHAVNTVTTNVPGPRVAQHLAGRRMLEAFPYVPIAGHVRVGVAIYSYDGGLGFGVTGDADTAPDVGVLASGIEAGMGELLEAARRRTAARSRRSRRGGPARSAGERASR